jgi:hypothetical protein
MTVIVTGRLQKFVWNCGGEKCAQVVEERWRVERDGVGIVKERGQW